MPYFKFPYSFWYSPNSFSLQHGLWGTLSLPSIPSRAPPSGRPCGTLVEGALPWVRLWPVESVQGGGDEDEQVWGSCDEEETSPGMCLPRPNWTALCETWGDVLASIFAQAKTKLSQSMISVWFSLNAVSMFSHKPKFKTWIRPQSNLNLFSDC